MNNNFLFLEKATLNGDIIEFICIDTEAIILDKVKDTDDLPVYKFSMDRSNKGHRAYFQKMSRRFVSEKTRTLTDILTAMQGSYFFMNPAFLAK